jgi:CRP-like cAMP-binding protein
LWRVVCRDPSSSGYEFREHSRLTGEDLVAINAWSHTDRDLDPDKNLIRQGDDPEMSAVAIAGLVARYHSLPDGGRQYLSFHMPGDMPDS